MRQKTPSRTAVICILIKAFKKKNSVKAPHSFAVYLPKRYFLVIKYFQFLVRFRFAITKTLLFKCIENFTTKNRIFFQIKKKSDIFHISAQNIDCGYLLEPPRRAPTIYLSK